MVLTPLPRTFYEQDTLTVAKSLLGHYLVHTHLTTQVGRIVEVEAYLGPQDLACHSARGLTKRTEVMFGPAGHAYIYLIYGLYHCCNVVTEQEGVATAVLLRAVEPIQGIEAKTKGPGLLCKAMHIDKRLNGHDLLSEDFFIAAAAEDTPFTITERPRIGVHYAKEWAAKPLRFYIEGNAFISRL